MTSLMSAWIPTRVSNDPCCLLACKSTIFGRTFSKVMAKKAGRELGLQDDLNSELIPLCLNNLDLPS